MAGYTYKGKQTLGTDREIRHPERITLPRQPKIQRPTTAECGTLSGHQTHRNRGEQPCRPCLDAHNAYQRERKHRPDVREKNREYMRQYRARRKEAA